MSATFDSEPEVFRTGEILHPEEHVNVVHVKEHRLTDRDRLAIKIANRRDRLRSRKKLSKVLRVRDPRRKKKADGVAAEIFHATEVHINEILHPHLDDGSHDFLDMSSSVAAKDDRTIQLPDFFDCRVAWGRYCWYPVRNQGNCGSCYIVGLSDAVTNRACIASKYAGGGGGGAGMGMLGSTGREEAALKQGLDPSSNTIPALSPQAVMSCLAEEVNGFENPDTIMGKLDGDFSPCDGGNLLRVANYASRSGFVKEGACAGGGCSSRSSCICRAAGREEEGACANAFACVPYCVEFSKNKETRRTCPLAAEDRDGTRPRPGKTVVGSLAFQTSSRNLVVPSRTSRDLGEQTMLFPYVSNISAANIATVVENVKHIKVELMRRGPVAATLMFNIAAERLLAKQSGFDFDVHALDFRHAAGYAAPKRQDFENHTIKVIGWARIQNASGKPQDKPQDVWIIQNSWGGDWGGSCRLDNPKLKLFRQNSSESIPLSEYPSYPSSALLKSRGYFFFPMADAEFVTGFGGAIPFVNSVETRAVAPVPQGIRFTDSNCSVATATEYAQTSSPPSFAPSSSPGTPPILALVIAGIVAFWIVVALLLLFFRKRKSDRAGSDATV